MRSALWLAAFVAAVFLLVALLADRAIDTTDIPTTTEETP